jgi:epoxide hydrolase-like predicted phosphatase
VIKAIILDCFGVLYQSPGYDEVPDPQRQKIVMGMVRNQELLDYVQRLRPACKIGVLSNCRAGLFEEFFSDLERATLFDAVIISSEVGLMKPQPEIYYLACQRLKVRPEEALFFDDQATYCNAAVGVGMHAAVYRSSQQAIQEISSALHR